MSEDLNTQVAALQRELLGVQEILAFVLQDAGQPVVITKEALRKGLPEGTQIRIDENLVDETFVVSIGVGINE